MLKISLKLHVIIKMFKNLIKFKYFHQIKINRKIVILSPLMYYLFKISIVIS